MFTAAEISELHETYVDALPDVCTITNPAAPGTTAVVLTDVPCAVLRPTRNQFDGAGYQPISTRVDYTVTVPLGTDVWTGAVIQVTGGMRLKAGEIVRPASYSHCLYVECTESAA